MSRPKPSILMSRVDSKTFKAEQVLAAAAIYAVFLDGQPINLRSINTVYDTGPKYKKSSFPNPGHAYNLASKLNSTFKTDKFVVMKLIQGVQIDEYPDDCLTTAL
jgi:hypothetical protein